MKTSKPLSRLMALVLSIALVFTMTPFSMSAEEPGYAHEFDETSDYAEDEAFGHDYGGTCDSIEADPNEHINDEANGEDDESSHGGTYGNDEDEHYIHDHNGDNGDIGTEPRGHEQDENFVGLPPGDSGDVATPAAVFTIEKDEYETTALYLDGGLPVTDAMLLRGVIASDENGNSVSVNVTGTDGLDRQNPQPRGTFPPQPYIIIYEAVHPDTGEAFTTQREAYVTAGITPFETR